MSKFNHSYHLHSRVLQLSEDPNINFIDVKVVFRVLHESKWGSLLFPDYIEDLSGEVQAKVLELGVSQESKLA